MHRGGIRCSIQSVLWSPVGAPAGVPGPRRSADDCDAGWFAPVATRRRPMLGPFGPRRRLAVFARGGDPPEPPGGAPTPVGVPLRPSLGSGPSRPPEGRLRPRNPSASGPWSTSASRAPPAPPPLSLSPSLRRKGPRATCACRRSTRRARGPAAASTTAQRSSRVRQADRHHGPSTTAAPRQRAPAETSPRHPGGSTGFRGGYLGAEFCPRPDNPPGTHNPATPPQKAAHTQTA
jgi:hypothetical protein